MCPWQCLKKLKRKFVVLGIHAYASFFTLVVVVVVGFMDGRGLGPVWCQRGEQGNKLGVLSRPTQLKVNFARPLSMASETPLGQWKTIQVMLEEALPAPPGFLTKKDVVLCGLMRPGQGLGKIRGPVLLCCKTLWKNFKWTSVHKLNLEQMSLLLACLGICYG